MLVHKKKAEESNNIKHLQGQKLNLWTLKLTMLLK